MERRYLTVAEAASVMRVGRPKVERLIARGALHVVGAVVGRRLIDGREIDRLMASPATGAGLGE